MASPLFLASCWDRLAKTFFFTKDTSFEGNLGHLTSAEGREFGVGGHKLIGCGKILLKNRVNAITQRDSVLKRRYRPIYDQNRFFAHCADAGHSLNRGANEQDSNPRSHT